MRNHAARECWIDGLGWVPYPIQVPDPIPVIYELITDSKTVTDYIKTVWCGPPAPLPRVVRDIARPYQASRYIPAIYAGDPESVHTYTKTLLGQNPQMMCAWVYEILDPYPVNPQWSLIIWKCWDR